MNDHHPQESLPADPGLHPIDAAAYATELFELDCEIVQNTDGMIAFGSSEELLTFLTVEHESTTFILNDQVGKQLGYFSLVDIAPTTMEILTIGVVPEARGNGHGTTMMQHAERIALDAGKATMQLVAKISNTEAITFYENHKYVHKGQSNDHYSGYDNEPRVILEKRLENGMNQRQY
jgi:ribosomal protein S18 acetylase RimI-like enzyme